MGKIHYGRLSGFLKGLVNGKNNHVPVVTGCGRALPFQTSICQKWEEESPFSSPSLISRPYLGATQRRVLVGCTVADDGEGVLEAQ
jgi:hypothetical protein